jgi:hypothetical protein
MLDYAVADLVGVYVEVAFFGESQSSSGCLGALWPDLTKTTDLNFYPTFPIRHPSFQSITLVPTLTTCTGAYSVLFCLCVWVICNRRKLNIFLSSAAVVMYILSAIYVTLDLRRVADSYTINPKMPWIMTYVSDHVGTLDYVISSTYIADVGRIILLFSCYSGKFEDGFL